VCVGVLFAIRLALGVGRRIGERNFFAFFLIVG
jgi:hypothetical protein